MNIKAFLSKTVLAAALIVCASGRAGAAESSKPTVSVAATDSVLAIWQPAMGEGLAQMMITELSRLPNLQVLESVALNDLREERALGEGGEVEKSERIAKGHFKRAEYTFKTTITRFGGKESSSGGMGGFRINGFPGGVNIRKSENEVQIDWRIVDNTTRAVVRSGRGVGLEKGSSWSFGGYGGGGFNQNREFMDSALGKATMKAIAAITTEMESWTPPSRSGQQEVSDSSARKAKDQIRRTKGEVLLVESGKVWVSLGSERGFAKGDRLTVYKPVQKKNKAGKVVATEYQAAGDLELSKVQKDKSCAEAGAAALEEGWVVAASDLDVNDLE